MLSELTVFATRGDQLSRDQVASAVRALIDETVSVVEKADFLEALARKGETPGEISAFAAELRAKAVVLSVPEAVRQAGLLDVVGTGGDRAGTLNLSTAAALVAAAAGVYVAKHGNRAITSQCGSADVLQALGVPTECDPEESAARLRARGFTFLFAPRYHPAFRTIAPARALCAERGRRTIFNFLGPLLNPARPTFQLLGVPSPEWCEPLALALQRLGVRRGLVVCGRAGSWEDGEPRYLDELSTLGETRVASFQPGSGVALSSLRPADFALQPATLSDLAGGDSAQNAQQIRRILTGQERGPQRDAVLLNAGAALFAAGRASSIHEGWLLAQGVIARGDAGRKLDELTAPWTPP